MHKSKKNVKESLEANEGDCFWWRYRRDDKELTPHEVEKTHGASAVGVG